MKNGLEKRKKAYRPRSITEARLSMTAGENDIFDMLLTYVNQENDVDDNLFYKLNISDFKRDFGLEYEKNAYRKIKNAALKLSEKSIEILSDDNKSFIKFCLFQSVRWNEKSCEVEVELGNYIKKLMVQEKYKSSTFYHVGYTLPMDSQYSKRLYVMFREWLKTGIRYDNLDILRDKLQVPESYNYSRFKARVLDFSLNEINERTDIFVSYEEKYQPVRGGQKVIGLTFTINEKVCATDLIEQAGAQMVLGFLLSKDVEGITEKQAAAIYRVAQKAELTDQQIKDRISAVIRKKNVRNLTGYLMFAMSDKFSEQKESYNRFRNFAERKYSEEYFQLLEKKILYGLTAEDQARYNDLTEAANRY